MRPIPLTHEDTAMWGPEAKRLVIMPPGGDMLHDSIASVEAIIEPGVGYHCCVVMEDGDIEALQAGRRVWLTFMSPRMPVWSIGIETLEGG